MFPHHNGGQNQNIKVANRLFETGAEFRYLGMTVTNQNFIVLLYNHQYNRFAVNKPILLY
jgi:hypothetical protein